MADSNLDIKTVNELAAAIRELGQAEEKTGGLTKILHKNHEGLDKAMKLIGEETAPELGEALSAALKGPGGLISALISGFEYVKRRIEETNKELDSMAEKAAEPTFIEGIRARQKILDEATAASAAFTDQINKQLAGEQSITAELNAQLDLRTRINEANSQQAQAEVNAASAKIKAQLARGEIGSEVAAERETQVKLTTIQNAADTKHAAEDQMVADKGDALSKAQDRQATLKDNADVLTTTYNEEKARRAKNEVDFGDEAFDKKQKELNDPKRQEAIARLDEQILAGKEMVEVWKRNLANPSLTVADRNYNQVQIEFQKNLNRENLAEKANLEKPEKNLMQGRGQYLADKRSEPEFNALGIKAADARKEVEDNSKAIIDLTAELNKMVNAIIATRATENATVKVQQQTVLDEYAASLFTRSNAVIKKEQRAGGSINDHQSFLDAVNALKESQALGKALALAAKDATVSHSASLGAITEALRTLQDANQTAAAQIQNAANRGLSQ